MKIKKTIQNKLPISLFFVVILLSSCTSNNIEDVKNENYIGKTVAVSGIVQNTIKLGDFSGFTIKDETGTIGVSSQDLPVEGSNIRVKGILMKDVLLGYYIKLG